MSFTLTPFSRPLARRRSAGLCALVLIVLGAWPEAPRAAATSLLWKASNGRGTIYLAGSIHMLTAEYYPLNPALMTAFEDSDLLMEEIDFNAAQMTDAQMLMLVRLGVCSTTLTLPSFAPLATTSGTKYASGSSSTPSGASTSW